MPICSSPLPSTPVALMMPFAAARYEEGKDESVSQSRFILVISRAGPAQRVQNEER